MTMISNTIAGLISGRMVDLADPKIEDISIEDIATSLSRICRFNGHTNTLLSVACHSINVAANVPPAYRLEALLHDAAEAYVGDVVRPLKLMLAGKIEPVEQRFDSLIRRKYGLPEKLSHAVESADNLLLRHEIEQYTAISCNFYTPLSPNERELLQTECAPDGYLIGHDIHSAASEERFLRLFDLYGGIRG